MLSVGRQSHGGKLTIFPFTDQISKIGLKPAAGSVEVWHSATGASLYISPPSASGSFLSAFWHIPVGSAPKLVTVFLNDKGWKITILKNTARPKSWIKDPEPRPRESERPPESLDRSRLLGFPEKGAYKVDVSAFLALEACLNSSMACMHVLIFPCWLGSRLYVAICRW